MPTARRRDNIDYLLGRFVELLLALRPRSILDVGCGTGALLRRCRAAGIQAFGIEPDLQEVTAANRNDAAIDRAAGVAVACGQAEHLPCASRSTDWVTFRHVPHHLANPAAAFAAALRVCRTGVLIAEPWFDREVPCQRNARAVDSWVKRQHRRGGAIHGEVLDVQAIRAALGDAAFDLEVDVMLSLRTRPEDDLMGEVEPLLAALPPDHPDRAAWREIRRRIDRDGVSWNGSVLVTARPDRSDG